MTKRHSDPLRELADKYDRLFDLLIELAVECGASDDITPHNALKKLEAELKEKKTWERTAEEMGYTTVLRALKANRQTLAFPAVPDDLQVGPPAHWVHPGGFEEIAVGSKTVRQRIPAVSTQKAKRMLKQLLPDMERYCQNATQQDLDAIKEAFYSLSYEQFASDLNRFIAEDAGRSEEHLVVAEKEEVDPRVPAGELIQQYEYATLRWFKSQTDFSIVVKETKWLENPATIDEAAGLDLIQSKGPDESKEHAVASLLIPRSVLELAGIEFKDMPLLYAYNNSLSLDEGGKFLPTDGKQFLGRLRKLGLGVTIKDYKEAVDAMRAPEPTPSAEPA